MQTSSRREPELAAKELVAGRYLLLRQRARGSSGEVFVAQDESTGELALTGDTRKSAEIFRERIERLQATGEHARVVVMHHYRVRLARLMGDHEAVHSALANRRDAAAESGNPAVYALAQRLSEDRGTRSEVPIHSAGRQAC